VFVKERLEVRGNTDWDRKEEEEGRSEGSERSGRINT